MQGTYITTGVSQYPAVGSCTSKIQAHFGQALGELFASFIFPIRLNAMREYTYYVLYTHNRHLHVSQVRGQFFVADAIHQTAHS